MAHCVDNEQQKNDIHLLISILRYLHRFLFIICDILILILQLSGEEMF